MGQAIQPYRRSSLPKVGTSIPHLVRRPALTVGTLASVELAFPVTNRAARRFRSTAWGNLALDVAGMNGYMVSWHMIGSVKRCGRVGDAMSGRPGESTSMALTPTLSNAF